MKITRFYCDLCDNHVWEFEMEDYDLGLYWCEACGLFVMHPRKSTLEPLAGIACDTGKNL